MKPQLGETTFTQRARGFDARLEQYLAPPPVVVVLSGPAGVGKDSVARRMRELGHPFHFVVTTTDRPPRPGEVDGVDYEFVTTEEFRRMIAVGEFLEYAEVYGQLKGIPKKQVERALACGLDVLLRLDVNGAATVRDKIPGVIGIFLVPPSLDVLLRRLQSRGTDSCEQVQRRLETAIAELDRAEEFDYVVVNHEDRLDEAARQALAIMTAERCRTGRQPLSL